MQLLVDPIAYAPMRFLLTSCGFQTDEIVSACERLLGKPAAATSVAVINEAYAVELGDKRWMIKELQRLAEIFGGEIDCVNLLALSPDQVRRRMQDKDLVFVVGGNTDYLMSVFDRSGFSQLLPELLREAVYVGSSAGSMVAGRRISTAAYQEVFGEGGTFGVTRYLALADIAIQPHFGSAQFPQNREEVLSRVIRPEDGEVYAIGDHQAIVIEHGAVSFVGGTPYRVGCLPSSPISVA